MYISRVKNNLNRHKPIGLTLWNYGKGAVKLPGYTIYFYKDGDWYYGNSTKSYEMSPEEVTIARRGRRKLTGKESDEDALLTKSTYREDYWEQICQEYINDRPVQDISTQYGVSKVSIYRHLRLRNIPKRTNKGPGIGCRKKQTEMS